MRIALIGANGFVGGPILNDALARGHEVTALVRDPARLVKANRLEVAQVDVLSSDALCRALRFHEAVISAFSAHSQADVLDYYLRGNVAVVCKARRRHRVRL
jgi:putative NADH-flavin reductase